jgi:hypothetical protein
MGIYGAPERRRFFRAEATYGYSPDLKDIVERTPWKAGRESAIGRVLLERAPVHVLDAGRYLDDRKLHVSKVAWLLGFHEVRSFTHAFKRWTGNILPVDNLGHPPQRPQHLLRAIPPIDRWRPGLTALPSMPPAT